MIGVAYQHYLLEAPYIKFYACHGHPSIQHRKRKSASAWDFGGQL